MGEAEARGTVKQIEVALNLVIQAAEMARHNKISCGDLANKARLLSYVLPLYNAAKDDTTRRMLRKLREALDDAVKHVEVCKNSATAPRAVNAAAAKIKALATYIKDWEKALVLVNQAKLLKAIAS